MTLIERKGGRPGHLHRTAQAKETARSASSCNRSTGTIWPAAIAWRRNLALAALGQQEADSAKLDQIAKTGASIVAWEDKNTDASTIAAIHARGWKAWVWTVDDPARIGQLVQAKIDGIITNRPSQTRVTVAGRGGRASSVREPDRKPRAIEKPYLARLAGSLCLGLALTPFGRCSYSARPRRARRARMLRIFHRSRGWMEKFAMDGNRFHGSIYALRPSACRASGWFFSGMAVLGVCLLFRWYGPAEFGHRPSRRPARSSKRRPPNPFQTGRGRRRGRRHAAKKTPVAAVVNNEPISREDLARECLLHYGTDVLGKHGQSDVDLWPACQQRNIVITDKQVDEEIDRMARKFSFTQRPVAQDAGKRAWHQAGPLCQRHHLADAGPARIGQEPTDGQPARNWTRPMKASLARRSKCG